MARRRVSLFQVTTIVCLLFLACWLRSWWRADSVYRARGGWIVTLVAASGAVEFALSWDPDRLDQFNCRSVPPGRQVDNLAWFPNDHRARGWAWRGYGIGGWWDHPENGDEWLYLIRFPLAIPITALAAAAAWLWRREARRRGHGAGFPLAHTDSTSAPTPVAEEA